MAVRMAGLAFGGRAKERRDVVMPFDVGLGGEIEVAAVRLRLAGKRGLQVVVRLRSLQCFHCGLLAMRGLSGSPRRLDYLIADSISEKVRATSPPVCTA